MTSGGLGTMGYGLPAAIGVQVAHPDSLVIDIAGEASVLMTMQEMSTAVQYELPIKIFILNNQYMGMVRQWQQLLHGNRLSHSYTDALPDFVKLAEAYGGVGMRANKPGELDDAIKEMIKVKRPVIFDCRVAALENCFPMIPSGKAHNEMLLAELEASLTQASSSTNQLIDEKGKMRCGVLSTEAVSMGFRMFTQELRQRASKSSHARCRRRRPCLAAARRSGSAPRSWSSTRTTRRPAPSRCAAASSTSTALKRGRPETRGLDFGDARQSRPEYRLRRRAPACR